MMKFYRSFYTFILNRRYRVTIKGTDLLQKEGGKLVLPNHQSHVDPQIIAVQLFKHTPIVPVVNENFFKIPVIRFFLKKWGAIPVAQFQKGSRDPNTLQNIFAGTNKALDEGKCVIIYPSGQLQSIGIEQVKNKQSAHVVVSNLADDSDTRVLGTRISGLWGSTFSQAWKGNRPKFLPVFVKGIGYFFANLIFLVPKREVVIEIVDITEEAKLQSKKERREFNAYLDTFFNVNGVEEPSFVKHFFFLPKSKRKLPNSVVKKTKRLLDSEEKNKEEGVNA
jgi:long-chain-fatty-acid--[acyl-carrier-protein] ligase